MNSQLLIDSIVRQVTVLIAQLATSGGIRAPLAHLANQVFVELANELESQGVSRKVSADMFGMALRAYIRKVRRLSESQTGQGDTLWQAVLGFIKDEGLVTKRRVLERFQRDGEVEVLSVLHDLKESGLIFASGAGKDAVFRVASQEELGRLAQLTSDSGLDELLWVLVYRHGPMADGDLAKLVRKEPTDVSQVVSRLEALGRVVRNDEQLLTAHEFVIPLGSDDGWQAAVFDHFQAVVNTICQRLARSPLAQDNAGSVGGSTYSFDIWPGHPLELEVKAQLSEFRERSASLRARVEACNAATPHSGEWQQVMFYGGQCLLDLEREAKDTELGNA